MPDVLLGGIAINEVLVDPNGALNFDTDGNGTADSTDEFIELVNTTGAAIDISGLQLWDSGVGNWFTFPPGTVLQAGAHALVITGVQAGGSLPTGGPNDLFFDAGRASPLINNGGDNIIVYDPGNDEYIAATFNGDPLDDPTLNAGGYATFSTTASQQGSGENFGNDTDGESLQRVNDNSNTFVSDGPTPGTTNVCFLNGTLLGSPTGLIAVENLKIGDLLDTVDHGPQPVRWIHARTWSAKDIQHSPCLSTVRITQGALGKGLPLRDLRVSLQHRIVLKGAIVKRMYGVNEVMIAAKHLCTLPGVRIEAPKQTLTFYQCLFDHHEILCADGQHAESLYLGKEVLAALSARNLMDISAALGIDPIKVQDQIMLPARPFMSGKRAKALVAQLRKTDKQLCKRPGMHPLPA